MSVCRYMLDGMVWVRTCRDGYEAVTESVRRDEPLPHAFSGLVVVQRPLCLPSRRGSFLWPVLLEQNLINIHTRQIRLKQLEAQTTRMEKARRQ